MIARAPGFVPLEEHEQLLVMQWAFHATLTHSGAADPLNIRLSDMLVHTPNAARRSQRLAAWLKRQGMKAGFPDLLLPVRSLQYGLLAIEMKRRSHSTTSESQLEWIALLTRLRQRAVICHGADEAIEVIRAYLRGSEYTLTERAQLGR